MFEINTIGDQIKSHLSIIDTFARGRGHKRAEGKFVSLLMDFVIAQLPSNFEKILVVDFLQFPVIVKHQALSLLYCVNNHSPT